MTEPKVETPVSREDDGAALYQRYEPRLYRYCLGRLWSPDAAEDATHETLLHAADELERGFRPEVEAAWIFGIADEVCTGRRRSLLEQAGAPVDDLPDDLRRLIVLRQVEQMPYQAIADRLGVSLRSVERRLFEARRHLARRAARALDVVWMAAALKGALSGATAAKLAVAMVVAAGAGTTAVVVSSWDGRASDPVRPDAPVPAVEPATPPPTPLPASPAVPDPAPPSSGRPASPAAPAGESGSAVTGSPAGQAPAAELPAAAPTEPALDAPLAPVEDAAPAVDEPELPAVEEPSLPTLELPSLEPPALEPPALEPPALP